MNTAFLSRAHHTPTRARTHRPTRARDGNACWESSGEAAAAAEACADGEAGEAEGGSGAEAGAGEPLGRPEPPGHRCPLGDSACWESLEEEEAVAEGYAAGGASGASEG